MGGDNYGDIFRTGFVRHDAHSGYLSVLRDFLEVIIQT